MEISKTTAILVPAVTALVVSLLTIVITYLSHFLNRCANVDPVLVFYWDEGTKCWTIENVGVGPALNIYIAAKDKNNMWTPLDREPQVKYPDFKSFFLPSLAKGEKVKLAFDAIADNRPKSIVFGSEGCVSLYAEYWSSLNRHLLSTTSEHESKRRILHFYTKYSSALPPKDNNSVCRSFDYKTP